MPSTRPRPTSRSARPGRGRLRDMPEKRLRIDLRRFWGCPGVLPSRTRRAQNSPQHGPKTATSEAYHPPLQAESGDFAGSGGASRGPAAPIGASLVTARVSASAKVDISGLIGSWRRNVWGFGDSWYKGEVGTSLEWVRKVPPRKADSLLEQRGRRVDTPMQGAATDAILPNLP